jgi:hypothetical protein
VVIESGDCGRFVLREGVPADNSDDIASGFEIGEKYDLEAGDGSLRCEVCCGCSVPLRNSSDTVALEPAPRDPRGYDRRERHGIA